MFYNPCCMWLINSLYLAPSNYYYRPRMIFIFYEWWVYLFVWFVLVAPVSVWSLEIPRGHSFTNYTMRKDNDFRNYLFNNCTYYEVFIDEHCKCSASAFILHPTTLHGSWSLPQLLLQIDEYVCICLCIHIYVLYMHT